MLYCVPGVQTGGKMDDCMLNIQSGININIKRTDGEFIFCDFISFMKSQNVTITQ